MIVHLIGKGPIYETLLYSRIFMTPVERPHIGDLLICSGYPFTIRKDVISNYPMGVINIHTSLLPKYRGRHPVDWAMENKEPEIGITIHYIQDETIDTGDIILQDSIPYNGEGYDAVMKKLCALAPHMVDIAVEQIKNRCVYRRKQHAGLATYYPKRTKPRVY